MIEPEPITELAHKAVSGPRGSDYGHPYANFSLTAALWSPVLGVDVTPEQVAICMMQLKVARLAQTPDHRDTIIDIAGYAETLDMVNQWRRGWRPDRASDVPEDES